MSAKHLEIREYIIVELDNHLHLIGGQCGDPLDAGDVGHHSARRTEDLQRPHGRQRRGGEQAKTVRIILGMVEMIARVL